MSSPTRPSCSIVAYGRIPTTASSPLWIAASLLLLLFYIVLRYFPSGWPLLARRFRTERPQPVYAAPASLTFRYLIHYKRLIYTAADITGLYLAFSPALGRAPLFLPWDEIDFLPRRRWIFVRYQPLRLGSEERVRCTLFARHADMLLRDANREPIERIVDLGLGLPPGHPACTTTPTPAPTIKPSAAPRLRPPRSSCPQCVS